MRSDEKGSASCINAHILSPSSASRSIDPLLAVSAVYIVCTKWAPADYTSPNPLHTILQQCTSVLPNAAGWTIQLLPSRLAYTSLIAPLGTVRLPKLAQTQTQTLSSPASLPARARRGY